MHGGFERFQINIYTLLYKENRYHKRESLEMIVGITETNKPAEEVVFDKSSADFVL